MKNEIKKNKTISIFFLLLLSTIISCGGGNSGNSGSSNNTAASFKLSCDLANNYIARSPALSFPSTTIGNPLATAIVVHGKNGVPTAAHMVGIKDKLNSLGYDVIMPYMTWATLNWDGSLCDSITLLDKLVRIEKAAGQSVILVGHSLAGPGVLAFSALKNTSKPDAVVVVAPGHFIHFSFILEAAHAASISKANNLITMGFGDQINTFETLNGGVARTISLSAINYLSMHDINQFPNIKTSASLVAEPLLWLAGTQDNLTTIATNFGLRDSINNRAFLYQELIGTHLTVLSGPSANAIDTWYKGL